MKTLLSDRLKQLSPYVFEKLDQTKSMLREKGQDIIDLSVGDPDVQTPKEIVGKMKEALDDVSLHRYPSYIGSLVLRQAIANWYEDRFNVALNPKKQVMVLIGSKEGLAHAPLAFVNPDDEVLCPDIAYPVYETSTHFALAKTRFYALRESNQFLPNFDEIEKDDLSKVKMMFFNYPNNPTSACISLSDLERAFDFGLKHEILMCHDAAYTELAYDGLTCPSYMQVEAAKDHHLEFHSLSKTFNMTGWRVAFVVGSEKAIAAMARVKTSIDSGVFGAIQVAACHALENWKKYTDQNVTLFEKRRDLVSKALKELNISFKVPKATYYFWCKVPNQMSSFEYCDQVLQKTGVLITPGAGFGKGGEGYFRLSITSSEVRLQEAFYRMGKIKI